MQSWGTLRFSDHRGIAPAQVTVDEQGFTASLTHSKTLGSDRSVTMRLVVVNRACFVQRPEWMTTGWKLLVQEAPFERDYLLPVPTGNYGSCRRQELKYSVGSAMQTRVLSLLKVGEEPLFRHRVTHFWTPHSGRNFMPTAAAAVGYEKHERDMSGGWSAKGSDKYNRGCEATDHCHACHCCAYFSRYCSGRPLGRGRVARLSRDFHG